VAGVDARTLIEASLHSFGLVVADSWQEVIEGKVVTRMVPEGSPADRSHAQYVYASRTS
jgi:hypothetical protein